MNAGSPTRNRIVAALAAAAWLAIGIGAFQTFYLRIWTADRSALHERYVELPYRRIPGWRTLLEETAARTPPGARILIGLPHRPWQSGYGYGFRRAQYVLAGREAIPLLDPGPIGLTTPRSRERTSSSAGADVRSRRALSKSGEEPTARC